MIVIILKLIFINILWVIGWKILTAKGMVGEKLGEYGEKKVEQGYKIFDGLLICPYCLPNIHGILFVWPIAFILGVLPFEWNWKYLVVHVLMVCGSSFICGTLWTLHEMMGTKKKYLEHMEELKYFELKGKKFSHYKNKSK